jgi:hypothetical protein
VDDKEDITNQLKVDIVIQKQQSKTLKEILQDILENDLIDADKDELKKLIEMFYKEN